jgi:hypothetical protein
MKESTDLRIKTSQLLGRQSLKLYKGWKGDEQDIAREFDQNKKIGEEFGTWKNNVLVADTNGRVEKRILELLENSEEKN